MFEVDVRGSDRVYVQGGTGSTEIKFKNGRNTLKLIMSTQLAIELASELSWFVDNKVGTDNKI